MPHDPSTYRDLAERAWSWARSQVHTNDAGVWLPEDPAQTELGDYPYGMHSGSGGLAHVLTEIGLARELSEAERELADRIAATVLGRVEAETDYAYFDGLTSTLGILIALGAPGADRVIARLRELSTPTGWPAEWIDDRADTERRCNDATLGTASVLQGAVWAHRHDVPGAAELASYALDLLIAEQEPREQGPYWPFIPLRFLGDKGDVIMPNWSHGQAGIAGTLAAAGLELGRPDLVDLAAAGAAQLMTMADTSDGGLRFPHRLPGVEDLDTFTYSWCHGPTGTSLLFTALDRVGVDTVAGRSPREWEHACLHSLRVSGIPARLWPGFWDNDGRCCGTAGAGDVVLSAWQRHGRDIDLDFAVTLADALVDRAIRDGDHVYWRFTEHRNDDPLLPPAPGWMQGAAGIAAYLFRIARVLEQGRGAAAVARMDTWWSLPEEPSTSLSTSTRTDQPKEAPA